MRILFILLLPSLAFGAGLTEVPKVCHNGLMIRYGEVAGFCGEGGEDWPVKDGEPDWAFFEEDLEVEEDDVKEEEEEPEDADG